MIDIYKSILRQADIDFETERQESIVTKEGAKIGVSAKVKIPNLFEVGVDSGINADDEVHEKRIFKSVDYNLLLPQDISEILKKHEFSKRIIIENFHYLDEEIQNTLAFDLRVFEDYNILFIILGIWREKNRLSQFNGDLQDRLIEIPVEPWENEDFQLVVEAGEPLLNVSFADVVDVITENAFDSIGVFQELLKESCIAAGVEETIDGDAIDISKEHVNTAIERKIETYSSRHIRSLEAFVDQKTRSSDEVPLYLAYYFVHVLLSQDFESIATGLKRNTIRDRIKEIHHRSDDVRPSDLSYFLHKIVSTQLKKKIVPPLFDYDRSIRKLRIIDSTLYFFLKNTDMSDLLEEIEIPSDLNTKS